MAGLTAALDRWTCRACVALFMAILVTMVFQVTFRYALNAPLVWTEELARILYIWACYLGAPVALRRGNHVAIVFVSERLPRPLGRVVVLASQAIALVFFLQLAIQGAILASRSHTVEAITLPIPWSVIYAVAPLSAVLMTLETLEVTWRTIRGPAREVRA
ncbi:MAG TPA: TRAP transporter small permease [Candidatus Methylomirabilis sp.]|nr:TRAP transporter small permease [Candidatus Methylomirabilis sp.]